MCFKQLNDFHKAKNKTPLCPTCRAPIQENEVKKKILKKQGKEDAPSEINIEMKLS
jgi:hypothetical protein